AKTTHIHVLWPKLLQNKNGIVRKGLWHVCPAGVYEARLSSQDQLQVVVNFENCIKCETCWRTSDLVDWGRDGRHLFIYPVHSPVVPRLLAVVHAGGSARLALPKVVDPWKDRVNRLTNLLQAEQAWSPNGQDAEELRELYAIIGKLEAKLQEFDT